MEYIMTFDYHTHTVFSHGRGSIRDNVQEARSKGLEAIAISDHGPGHLTYGIKRSALPEMRNQIDELNKEFDDIDIYLSVEANILKTGNHLDVTKDEFKDYDFVIGGYHYGVTKGYCISNWLSNRGIMNFKKLMVKNTDMTVKAIYENDLKILTHPGDKGPFDTMELAKACSDRGTWMEISTHHKNLTVEQIKIAAKTDVLFVISSDAHIPQRVGTFEGGLARAMEAGLDPERIVNIRRVEK